MKFSFPMQNAKLVKRYKRFLADAILQDTGELVTAHCPNTGAMTSCGKPGDIVVLSYQPAAHRKLDYTWELTATTGGYIGIHTARANPVVEEAIRDGQIAELQSYSHIQREYRIGNSRMDFYLTDPVNHLPPCLVEVKNVTLFQNDVIRFPDAPTRRGQRHLLQLIEARKQGLRAIMFYLVNRPEGKTFQIAWDIDKDYGELLNQAIATGVEVLVYRARSTPERITIDEPLAFQQHPSAKGDRICRQ
jgi:sugar fermentation stimulation protein A